MKIPYTAKKKRFYNLIICFIFVLFSGISLSAQKEDYNWIMGNDGGYQSTVIDTFWTSFRFNFNEDPMQFEWMPARPMKFNRTCGVISHQNGELYCYSNGMNIDDSNHKVISGADTINYGDFWELWRVWYGNNKRNFGFTITQGILFLPWPGKADSIFYATIFFDDTFQDINLGKYGIISKSSNNNKGKLLLKDQSFHTGFVKNPMQAVKHANGRDWWITLIDQNNVDYYIYLLDVDGINLVKKQKVGQFNKGLSLGNVYFSSDGQKMVSIDALYWDRSTVISIFDFDRCSGTLSNGVFDKIPTYEGGIGIGAIFSPDGRYLYANNDYQLYQYDMSSDDIIASKILLDTFDGFQSYPDPDLYITTLGHWAYGPDGKLYNVSGAGSAHHMHVMHYPNEGGKASKFQQHGLKIANNAWTIPNFPNFRLGPLDGSPCDTLGLDNHPVAKYRYEADSIDYLRLRFTDLSYYRPETWSWDFGDGSPRVSTQSPYHTFSKPGVYNVCLTVSNENSNNTSCRTITLGTVSSDDVSVIRADISLFPNPVQDYLLITLGEYVPAYGLVMIYDVTGRPVITQRIYYGQNSVDMSAQSAGVYVWKVMDGEREIKEGKAVKI
jgi:hypothetical protein